MKWNLVLDNGHFFDSAKNQISGDVGTKQLHARDPKSISRPTALLLPGEGTQCLTVDVWPRCLEPLSGSASLGAIQTHLEHRATLHPYLAAVPKPKSTTDLSDGHDIQRASSIFRVDIGPGVI